jgi:hypothetical protein
MVEIKREEIFKFLSSAKALLEQADDGSLQLRFTNASSPLTYDFIMPLTETDEENNPKLVANIHISYPVTVPSYIADRLQDCSIEHIKNGNLFALGMQFKKDIRAAHLEKILPSFLHKNFPELNVHTRDACVVVVGSAEALNTFKQVMDFPETQEHLENIISARMGALGQRAAGSKVVSLFSARHEPAEP